ncbi:MAG: beta-N-acetylhexosaminidase [Paludibacter sp.]
MKIKLIILVLALNILFAFSQSTETEFHVIPAPISSISYAKIKSFDTVVKIAVAVKAIDEGKMLQKCLLSDFGLKSVIIKNSKDADIVLTLNSDKAKSEAYTLEINSKICISSNATSGLFYGIQSLRQIIKKNGNKYIVQKGKITDSPTFSWRAFMLDEGRYFKGKQAVKQLLDEMALLKMNVFQWHLTDDQGWRIEIKKYPKLTQIGSFRDSTEINHFGSNVFDGKPHAGFYTQTDIKEIVAYATKLHIQIIPEIEMPGHSSAAIAAYPCLGTSGKQIKVPCSFGPKIDIYNVSDPKVLEFFNDVFDEIISLFPANIIHIGGDEARYEQWTESKQIQDYMKQNGLSTPNELQVFFTNNIYKLLKSKNKRMMGWNEITGDKIHKFQEGASDKSETQKLQKSAIVQFWKGDSILLLNTLKNGNKIVNSNNVMSYLDYDYKSIPLSKAYSFNPIPSGTSASLSTQVLGLSCQMWGEFIPTIESMNFKVYPRLAAYAERGWTQPDKINYNRFKNSLPYFLNHWESIGIIYGPTN